MSTPRQTFRSARTPSAFSDITIHSNTPINIEATVSNNFDAHFDYIAEIAGISRLQITYSLNLELNKKSIFKAGQSAGASGSFFFFTADKKFIIKSISKTEKEVLLRILPKLVDHYIAT